MPVLPKGPGCVGCPLEERGEGFAPADGDPASPFLFVGEALGKVEALTGRPFVGDAGGMLQRILNLIGWTRDSIRIHNTISCRPPGDWFDERAPWYWGALQHCKYLDATLAERHPIVIPMGGVALKKVLRLEHAKKIRVQDFHGTVQRDPTDRFWVVPTFHPSFLQRGAHNLIGTVLWDLQQAEAVLREGGRKADPGNLVIDPPVEWFRAWVDQVVAARQQDREAYPLSSDVETPDKAAGQDEGELTSEDRSFQIIRQNFSCHPDEGVTVPDAEPYRAEMRRLYASPGPIWQWNREYDFERLVAAEYLREGQSQQVVDLMWLWHFLQSDLPRGLGFVAPFYSGWGPWKHLAQTESAKYAAIDALQTHRIGFGVLQDLAQTGQLAVGMRHTHVLHTAVLRPAQLVGVRIDRERLLAFKEELIGKARIALDQIQAAVPEVLQPLTPKQGMKIRPLADVLHVKASAFTRKGKPRAGKPVPEIKQELYARAAVIEKLVLKEVLCCQTCGAIDVQRRHRCRVPAGTGTSPRVDKDAAAPAGSVPRVELAVASVTRYYWREPFNPDSPDQVLAYLRHRGHAPGKAKKTQKDTTNKETLEKLSRTTKDPFYAAVLDYRAINKVKGTYVEGTERRLDKQDRLHAKPTFKPSTHRLSYVDPNITNVVADKENKDGKPPLAAGFRACVVAGNERPEWLTDEDLDRWWNNWNWRTPTPVWRGDWRDVPPADLFACRLLEVDFAAIEAVLTAYRAGDPEMLRVAQLGIHAALASHVLNRPYDPSASDEEIAAYFAAIKKDHPEVYDPAKRFIHGRNYGLTRHGMMRNFPHLFPTEAVAKKYEAVFAKMAPKIPKWQTESQRLAAKQHYLGGTDHPYGYRHWFWSVYTYRRLSATQYYRALAKARQTGVEAPVHEMNGQYFRMSEGEDAKRALAFFGQSTGAGVLKETLLRLLADPSSPSYIGDAYFGRTPLRAPIHDSGLFEIPVVVWDRILAIIGPEFTRPVQELPLPPEWEKGEYLAIGAAAKAGLDWKAMKAVALPTWAETTPTLDEDVSSGSPMELDDEEDWDALGRAVG